MRSPGGQCLTVCLGMGSGARPAGATRVDRTRERQRQQGEADRETGHPRMVRLPAGLRRAGPSPASGQRAGRRRGPAELPGLTWRIGDAPVQPLSVGPDGHRLHRPGDFNVEISCDRLTRGTNRVRIEARWTDGQASARDVELDHDDRTRWPLPYRGGFAGTSTGQPARGRGAGLCDVRTARHGTAAVVPG